MNKTVKRALERIFLDRIWIEKAARKIEVSALVRKLRPVPTPGGLRRFGSSGDGGYLLPDDLDGIDACISPGVSFECGFDEEIASRGIDVYMADASVEEAPVKNERFHFQRTFVDIMPSDKTVTLDELCATGDLAQKTGDLLLQMDIEGAEYRVLANASHDLIKRFRIIAIEFHELDLLFSRFGFNTIAPVFERLLATHRVVHIHPNNWSRVSRRGALSIPSVMEFTFYRKDRNPGGAMPDLAIPHPLDEDCAPERPSLVLPECWWR
jgi:Methyltransferase FkbM domain